MMESLREHGPIIALIVATIADRLVTVAYFGMETNTLVNQLDPFLWALTTAFLIGILAILWIDLEGYNNQTVRAFVSLVALFTSLAVATNLMVISGVI